MIKCPVCQKIIGLDAPVYQCSRGFIDNYGHFIEDASVVFHQECSESIHPYALLEEYIMDS